VSAASIALWFVVASAAGQTAFAAAPVPALAWSPTVAGSSPASYDFGSLGLGQASRVVFTLKNSGGSATSVLAITLTGSSSFTIPPNGDGCSATSLGPGKSCRVTVQFAAATAGPAGAVLTASSRKPTATAALTLLGGGKASPAIATSPSAGGPAGVTALHDDAALSGGSSPTGTIVFDLYGPSATADCSQGAVFTSTASVSGNGTYTSGTFTPSQAGTYWWTARYGGDAFDSPVASGCGAESATIAKASPAIATTVQTVGIGQAGATSVGDAATLSGFVGAVAGETVGFSLFGPFADAVTPTCTGAPIFATTGALDGTGAATTSATYTPTVAGTYVWVASYAGDALNNPVSAACDAANESVTISPAAASPTGSKTASGSYTNTYSWSIGESVDTSLIRQFGGGTATFHYTVIATHDGGTVGNVQVNGTIDVQNPDTAPVTLDGLTDRLSDGTVCTVDTSGGLTLTQPDTLFPYRCTLGALPSGPLDNTVTASWSQQTLSNGALLAAGQLPITFSGVQFTATTVDDCAAVSDSLGGALGTACVGDTNPARFTFANAVTVPQFNCTTVSNTGTFTTDDTATTGSSGESVRACGPVQTAAATRGFWNNMNGQRLITGGSSTGGVCNSGTWLRQFVTFQDLGATATCTDVANYVSSLLGGAAGLVETLRAEVIATALNVYFSDPALGGNLLPPAPPGAPQPLGGVTLDLTAIDLTHDVTSAFGNAPSLTVTQMLASATSQSNVGGTVWYGGLQATQMLAFDAFDAINSEGAFAP
jgi:hypothetical protein